MIAALPMYDWPEVRAETDALWRAIAAALLAEGIEAPAELTRDRALMDLWTDPGLLFAQTCGLPFRTRLRDHVTLVGTPDFDIEDTPPGHYRSILVARAGTTGEFIDFAGGLLAVNGTESQSGWAAPQNQAAAMGFGFTRILVTGAHVASAESVADGRADLAAIDAVTWRLITRYRPQTARALRIVTRTAPTPGLPYVTSKSRDPAPLARATAAGIAALAPPVREKLGLRAMVALPASRYLAVPTPPAPDPVGQPG